MYKIRLYFLTCIILTSSVLANMNFQDVCSDELNLKRPAIPQAIARNRSCLQKCLYHKEEKLDQNGGYVASKFINVTNIDVCINTVKSTDTCLKAMDMQACIQFITTKYPKYEDCTKFLVPNGLSGDTHFKKKSCYDRCVFIKDGKLFENGLVKMDYFKTIYVNLSREAIAGYCNQLVYDVNNCSRDITRFVCVNYILYATSNETIKREMDCAESTKTYPFTQVDRPKTPNACYKRCVLIKTGAIVEDGIFNINFRKQKNLTSKQLEEAIKICEKYVTKTDKCNRDLYIFDCVKYVTSTKESTLQLQKDCANETKTSLVKYNDVKYNNRTCFDRCLLIKQGSLNPKGAINKRKLKEMTINATIIDNSIAICSKQINKTQHKCQSDMEVYKCVTENISYEIQLVCTAKTMLNYGNSNITVFNACLNVCKLKLAGVLDENGDIIPRVLLHLDKTIVAIKDVSKSCKNSVTQGEGCARVMNVYKCVLNSLQNGGFGFI